jgi:hypothetical protein
MTTKLRSLLPRKPRPSPELTDAREELEKTQQLLESTKDQTPEIESVAERLESERAANHFGEALTRSWARRQRTNTPTSVESTQRPR